ncbi:regulatory protein RecX [Pseudoteredinibacter isoporae]|uniref:regulatory protein RecX n=1 Tax=Pseudoteredinibacter isoporae TaxID=570281 RepID=UPI0031098181
MKNIVSLDDYRDEPVANNEPSGREVLAKIKNSALAAISRREYCRAELFSKLARQHDKTELIDEVLNWLEELSYLDDQRYAAMFLRASISKRRGPTRIRMEMKHKGLSNVSIDSALLESDVDWHALALESLQGRFSGPSMDVKDKSKRYRYLQAQGFSGDQIHYALAEANRAVGE